MSESLKRMAEEYRVNAKPMLERIKKLKRLLAQTDTRTAEWKRLRGRILTLEAIYDDNIHTAAYLENYHGGD